MIKFVESLESHGTEWFDTGIEIKSGIRAEIEFEFTEIYNESWVMGGSNNPQRIGYFAGIFNNQLYTGNFASYSPNTLGVGIRVKASFSVDYNISRTIYLFGRNWDNVADGFAKCKVYSFKAWYNNQLIADCVPAVNTTTGEVGMYDAISGTMYYNQGGGAFTPHEGWYIDDYGINNAYFNDMPSATEKPYPTALWRIVPGTNNNVPYHDFMPDIESIHITPVKQPPYIIVYDMRTEQTGFNNHGLCILHPSECIETETLNGGWEITLTHPIDTAGTWQYIVESNILKVDEQLFIIRKIEQSFRNGDGSVKAYAEHIFYVMNEAWIFPNYQWQGSVQKVIDILTGFNDERYASSDIKYTFSGKSDIPKTLSKHVEDSGETPVEAIMGESGLIAKCGGFLYRDNFYFSIQEKMEGAIENAFDIRVGKNLTGIKRVVDMSNFVTYFMGFLPDKVTFFAVSWVWNKGSDQFFRTIKKSKIFNYDALELTYEDQFKLLESDVMAYFNAYCKPLLSYEFDIQDLSQNPDYQEFTNLARYKVGDVGKVYDERLGVSLNLPITKVRKNHITHRVEKVWIGNAQRTFTRPAAYNVDISELGKAEEVGITGQLKDYEYNNIFDAYGNRILINVKE